MIPLTPFEREDAELYQTLNEKGDEKEVDKTD